MEKQIFYGDDDVANSLGYQFLTPTAKINLENSRRNQPNLFSHSPAMSDEIDRLLMEFQRWRKAGGIRGINTVDVSDYRRHLNNILTDVYAAHQSDPECYVGYSRGKSKYVRGGSYWDAVADKQILRKGIYLPLIKFLCEIGMIENHVAESGQHQISSRMKATMELICILQERDISWASNRRDMSVSAVIVRDEDKNTIAHPNQDGFDPKKAEEILRRINENLQSSFLNLNVSDNQQEAIRRRLSYDVQEDEGEEDEEDDFRGPLDFSDRYLRRIFAKGSFRCGGRFYGGWWQRLPSEYRKFIEIDGAVTREMDYSTMQARVLYASVGHTPPEDSYIVPGWDKNLRKVIKKAFNQLVNGKVGMRNELRWHMFAPNLDPDPLPEWWGHFGKYLRCALRRVYFRTQTGRDYSDLLRDLKAMHEPIDKFFFSQAWTWLQRIDSDIAEMVMLRLLDEGHTVLPIHDSFIVRRSAEGLLREAMNEAFYKFVGIPAVIDEDESIYDRKSDRHFVNAHEIKDEAFEDLKDRSLYYQRQAQWEQVWGPST